MSEHSVSALDRHVRRPTAEAEEGFCRSAALNAFCVSYDRLFHPATRLSSTHSLVFQYVLLLALPSSFFVLRCFHSSRHSYRLHCTSIDFYHQMKYPPAMLSIMQDKILLMHVLGLREREGWEPFYGVLTQGRRLPTYTAVVAGVLTSCRPVVGRQLHTYTLAHYRTSPADVSAGGSINVLAYPVEDGSLSSGPISHGLAVFGAEECSGRVHTVCTQ